LNQKGFHKEAFVGDQYITQFYCVFRVSSCRKMNLSH
jgi:hypothetical protein